MTVEDEVIQDQHMAVEEKWEEKKGNIILEGAQARDMDLGMHQEGELAQEGPRTEVATALEALGRAPAVAEAVLTVEG